MLWVNTVTVGCKQFANILFPLPTFSQIWVLPRSTLKRTKSTKCLYNNRIKYNPLAEYSIYNAAPQAISIFCQLLDIVLYRIIHCSCKEIENRHTTTRNYKTLPGPLGHQSPLSLIDLNNWKKAIYPGIISWKYSTQFSKM
jgi:hypothetical protein